VSRFWRSCSECGALAWKGNERWVERPEEARWVFANGYCNRCAGDQGEHLEELRMKNDPKYSEMVLGKRRRVLRDNDKDTEKRRIRRERRDEELQSAWEFSGVARLFAEDEG
jgi:hypothetical protein